MTNPEEDGPRLSSTSRTEALSDGVFAIAITLLVLTIEPPSPTELGARSLLSALLHNWPSYLAYLAAFMTTGVAWANHHAAFAKVTGIDPALQWWNMLLLLVVGLTPFQTALVADYFSESLYDASARTAAVVFALASALRPLVWVIVWRHLNRRRALLDQSVTPAHGRLEVRRAAIGLGLYLVAAVIGLVLPILALALCLALAIFYAVTARGEHRMADKGTKT